MKALLLTVLLTVSCSKNASLSKDAMGLRLTNVEMEVTRLHEIEWHVGKRKEITVSQSFTFMVDTPHVSEEDLNHLTELKGVNAWIIRLIVQRGSERQDLGSLYTPFKPKKVVRGSAGGAPTNVSLKVYYAAAYPSERFRFFKCPAFAHNKRISEMDIKGELTPFEIPIEQVTHYDEKSQLVELAPSSFNGGHSLEGEYYIEIAPYNYDKKEIHASFKRIPMYIQVSKEVKVPMEECSGLHPELD